MPRKKKEIELDSNVQIEIFTKVFLEMIEVPSLRWKLKSMIDSLDNVDNAALNLNLRKLELEIIKEGGDIND